MHFEGGESDLFCSFVAPIATESAFCRAVFFADLSLPYISSHYAQFLRNSVSSIFLRACFYETKSILDCFES